jgi:hypothetical protein
MILVPEHHLSPACAAGAAGWSVVEGAGVAEAQAARRNVATKSNEMKILMRAVPVILLSPQLFGCTEWKGI